ncbi:OmpP1/FadL family transporter [Plastorhodobacter daqingensis]|uniref:OmpP1/FadL family transporter n=1 Tax=Plastorhodobacter daqingensis TaxID=1387281 RepID=A0ABW2UFD9_9RHOB
MMKTLAPAGAMALALSTTAAMATVERSPQSMAILFEPGRYFELGISNVNPKVSGTVGGGALGSGDMTRSYQSLSFGMKMPITPDLDVALIIDEPIGADLLYPTGTGYPLAGSNAEINSVGVTGVLRYRFNENMSAYGGLRAVRTNGEVELFTPSFTYRMSVDDDVAFGWLLGAAYELPQYAARVAVTYNSRLKHNFDASEALTTGLGTMSQDTAFSTIIPESVNIEAQTGIAADTLLMGGIRWVKWTDFDITPPLYESVTGGTLVSYRTEAVVYSIGIGRRFNENWSGALMASYQTDGFTPTSNLGPTDGQRSIGVAVTYTQDNIKVTGGLRYIDLGDATTVPPIGGQFNDNHAIAAGLRIGYTF